MQRHYKHKVSGFKEWDQHSHASEYLLYPENITDKLSIDEVSLSKGELYTIVTNKNIRNKNKKSLVAIVKGTSSRLIQEILDKIPLNIREKVTEVTLDMAKNMSLVVDTSFPKARKVTDKFHVLKLVMDAMQHVRVKLRWQAIDDENEAIKKAKANKEKYISKVFKNGDTPKQLLARSRYLLYKNKSEWTSHQKTRAKILFENYPTLKQAYDLVMDFKQIYNRNKNEEDLIHMSNKQYAYYKFNLWKSKIEEVKIKEFNTAAHSIEIHFDTIMNYFNHYSTNANAESFNSKIKGFRANLRGVSDVKFFLFRLEKLFA